MDVKLQCPICETQNLKPAGESYQCNNCGMATDASFKGLTKESEQYLAIDDDLKEFVRFIDDSMWVPSQVQFEQGSILPAKVDGKLVYQTTFNEDSLTTELFSEALGFIIEKFHG
tara:strand:+ start:74 stop:418 length:345 start_codon:yes stop_codon:yes gene_type:complete